MGTHLYSGELIFGGIQFATNCFFWERGGGNGWWLNIRFMITMCCVVHPQDFHRPFWRQEMAPHVRHILRREWSFHAICWWHQKEIGDRCRARIGRRGHSEYRWNIRCTRVSDHWLQSVGYNSTWSGNKRFGNFLSKGNWQCKALAGIFWQSQSHKRYKSKCSLGVSPPGTRGCGRGTTRVQWITWTICTYWIEVNVTNVRMRKATSQIKVSNCLVLSSIFAWLHHSLHRGTTVYLLDYIPKRFNLATWARQENYWFAAYFSGIILSIGLFRVAP